MRNYPATLLCDFYKISHRAQYPQGTEKVYSTWTPRGSRIDNIDQVVAFGFQYFIKEYLIDYFNDMFFNRPLADVLSEYDRIIKYALGDSSPAHSHIESLHKLGYLPLKIMAVPEGTKVPIRVPMLTIENTISKFYWLTNYIETLFSTEVWMMCTSATIADTYRSVLDKYAAMTSDSPDFVNFQGHDFSMRGHASLQSADKSGAAHLLSFTGTDTIPAIMFLEKYYHANIEQDLVGKSLPATEHSVMCAYGADKEFDTYKHLITETYPDGFLSIVSDTWDLWEVLDGIVKPLKDDIMKRDGKIIVRPDSGDPVKILCGDSDSWRTDIEKGVVEVLWDIFGGTINSKGYKELDSHIGAIYGDAITVERATEICKQLESKGFASTNVVYGIGSYTYQYNTRDTFGFAIKSTYVCVNGEERLIYKDPVTDDGTKKSQKGMVVTQYENGVLSCTDNLSEHERDTLAQANEMKAIFIDGELIVDTTLAEIKKVLESQ